MKLTQGATVSEPLSLLYRCEACGKEGPGQCLRTGWIQYPAGWFLWASDTGAGLACSLECTRIKDSEDLEDVGAPVNPHIINHLRGYGVDEEE